MLNSCFLPYKDIHKGKSAALLGNGPTFNEYDNTKNIITVGCNQHIRCDWLDLDYYFIGDAEDKTKGFNNDPKAYFNYFKNIHPKNNFVRINRPGPFCTERCASVPEGLSNCIYYKADRCIKEWNDLSSDPTQSFCISGSITFEMLQFVLYTGIKRLYLIGQDCSLHKGSFYNEKTRFSNKTTSMSLVKRWLQVKEFLDNKFPEVEVRIINPVLMKHFEECTYNDIIEN